MWTPNVARPKMAHADRSSANATLANVLLDDSAEPVKIDEPDGP